MTQNEINISDIELDVLELSFYLSEKGDKINAERAREIAQKLKGLQNEEFKLSS